MFRRNCEQAIASFRWAIVFVAMFVLVSEAADKPSPRSRPPEWAIPIELIGLPNFYQVDSKLYRGAQPTPEGFRQLAKLGVKSIISLRSFHSDREMMPGLGFIYERIKVKSWHPENEDLIHFLRFVNNSHHYPVFVHCEFGSDRTGAMIAAYRIIVQKWTKQAAIKEMTEGGYGFNPVWENLKSWLLDLDVESIRQQLADL